MDSKCETESVVNDGKSGRKEEKTITFEREGDGCCSSLRSL